MHQRVKGSVVIFLKENQEKILSKKIKTQEYSENGSGPEEVLC